MFKQSDLNNQEIGAIAGGSGGTILGVLSQLLDNSERNEYLKEWKRWGTQVSERRHEAFEKLKRAVKAERAWNKDLERARELARTGRTAIMSVPQPEPGAVGKALSDYNKQRSQWSSLVHFRKGALRNIKTRKLVRSGKAGLILGGVGLLGGYGLGGMLDNSDGGDTGSDKQKLVNKPTAPEPVNKPTVSAPVINAPVSSTPVNKPKVSKPVNKPTESKPITKNTEHEGQLNLLNLLMQPGTGTVIRGAGGAGLGYLIGDKLGDNGALGAGLGGFLGLTPEILKYTPKLVDAVKNMFSKGAAANAGRIAAQQAYYYPGYH